ncbi:MAG TPA: hypothetical protein VIX87_00230 [Steroidobacteraceae bacterium]
MRLLFLSLLVVNVAFFCWARWIDRPPIVAAAVNRDAGIPPLQLVPREAARTVSAAPAPALAAPAAGPTSAPGSAALAGGSTATASGSSGANAGTPVAAASGRCRSLGPFEDTGAASAAADRLRARGLNPHDRSAETTNPNIYWVYVGELTADMRHRALETLNNAGIHDAALMTSPEQSDRVSVGVFADQAHAVRRAEQVRALGLKPTLGLRARTVTAHWLDFDVKAGDADPKAAELIGAAAARAPTTLGPVKIADCPAPGATG